MNYYYEFPENISVLSRPGGGYYVLRNQQAGNVAEAAFRHATRIWEEDADGVRIIKNYNALVDTTPGPLEYNEQEFLIVKLRAKNLI
jgi:hypothetical protein